MLFKPLWRKSLAIIACVSFFAILWFPALTSAIVPLPEQKTSAGGSDTNVKLRDCGVKAIVEFGSSLGTKALLGAAGALEAIVVGNKPPDPFPRVTINPGLTIANCVSTILEEVAKVALEKLRKRLLDRVTDDIVAWISDGKDPKFITNFGEFIEDSAKDAIGETAIAVGLADLCSPLRARIPPFLKPIPTFSKQVSCTLDDIVDNIEDFYQDFSKGGFLAYAEAWSPQNNAVGLLFATQDQLMVETEKKRKQAELAALTGGGYKPIEECLEWSLSGQLITTGEFYSAPVIPGDTFPYYHPYLPPTPDDADRRTLQNPRYSCSRKRITIPPAGTQQIANVALNTDTQYLANTNDLTPYIQAIYTAATSRIIKEGVRGLRGALTNLRSESGGGRALRPLPDAASCTSDAIAALQHAERAEREQDCRYAGYSSEYRIATNLASQFRNELSAQITEARASISAASTTLNHAHSLNEGLIAATAILFECEMFRFGNACETTSSSLAIARTRTLQLKSDRDVLTSTLQSINEIGGVLASNATQSEQTLAPFLASVSSFLNLIRTTQNRLNELVAELRKTAATNEAALRACEAASYSCGWSPPSS